MTTTYKKFQGTIFVLFMYNDNTLENALKQGSLHKFQYYGIY